MNESHVNFKTPHRQALGFNGLTVRDGIPASTRLPPKYMEKMKDLCATLNISCAEWMRTLIIGTLNSSRLNKELEDRKNG